MSFTPERTTDRAKWQRAFNRISAKHFDFVVCKATDLSVVCVVALDDKSHETRSRKERDNFIVSVGRAAGVPLLQVPGKAAYTVLALQAKFATTIDSARSPGHDEDSSIY